MSKETTNTSKFDLFPEGTYLMKVVGLPEKRTAASGKSTYRIWKFNVLLNGKARGLSIVLLPSMSRDLLLALGGIEVSANNIEWDDELVDGLVVKATITHVVDNKGRLREQLSNIEAMDPTQFVEEGTNDKVQWEE